MLYIAGRSIPSKLTERVRARLGYPVCGVCGGGWSLLDLRCGQVLLWHRVHAGTPTRTLLEALLGLHQPCLPVGQWFVYSSWYCWDFSRQRWERTSRPGNEARCGIELSAILWSVAMNKWNPKDKLLCILLCHI